MAEASLKKVVGRAPSHQSVHERSKLLPMTHHDKRKKKTRCLMKGYGGNG